MKIIRSLVALAVAAAIAPSVNAQEKKEVRTVVVKNGSVVTVDGARPHVRLRGFLGVETMSMTPELREHFRTAKDAGVLVSRVVPESPAAKAGLRVGDIITAVDGKRVESPLDISRAVREKKKGEALRVDYSRDGANATAMTTIVERERKIVDLSDLDIRIPDIQIPEIHLEDIQVPDVGPRLEQYFNSPEWKAKVARMQKLPDCADMQQRMKEIESKMRVLEKKLGDK